MIAMIVPCFNEAKRFDVLTWQSMIDTHTYCQWYFVDDGSNDSTHEILSQLRGSNVKILKLGQNRGKGEAVRAGFEFILGSAPIDFFDRIGYIDADGAFSPSDVLGCLAESENLLTSDSSYQIFIGSRVKLAGRRIQRNNVRHYLGRLIATYICLGWASAPYDTQSGFKIFYNSPRLSLAVSRPFETSWFFDIELMLRLQNTNSPEGIWESPLSGWIEISGGAIRIRGFFLIFKQILRIRKIVRKSLESD